MAVKLVESSTILRITVPHKAGAITKELPTALEPSPLPHGCHRCFHPLPAGDAASNQGVEVVKINQDTMT